MTDNDPFLKELRQRADSAHRSVDRADDVPPELWQHVHAQINTEEEERSDMSTITMPVKLESVSQPGGPVGSRRFGHYVNLAATIAIVLGVALAGWFATMQLNQPDGSNGQFAFLGQMDESDYPNPLGSTAQDFPWMDDYREVYPRLGSSIGTVFGDEPTQTAFDEASAVISHYIACLQEDGTVAMMLRFADPFSIQHHIRVEFPFYRSEEQVREYVAAWLQSGEQYHALSFERQGEMLTFRQSDQKSGASTQIHNFGMGFDQIIYIGSEVYDDSGEFLGYYHPSIRQPSDESLNYGLLFTLIHSQYTNEWYVVTDGRWLSTGDI